jgi:hypothetical protein
MIWRVVFILGCIFGLTWLSWWVSDGSSWSVLAAVAVGGSSGMIGCFWVMDCWDQRKSIDKPDWLG